MSGHIKQATDLSKQTKQATDLSKQIKQATDLSKQTKQATDLSKQTKQATDLSKQTKQATDLSKQINQATDLSKQINQATDLSKQINQATDLSKQLVVSPSSEGQTVDVDDALVLSADVGHDLLGVLHPGRGLAVREEEHHGHALLLAGPLQQLDAFHQRGVQVGGWGGPESIIIIIINKLNI